MRRHGGTVGSIRAIQASGWLWPWRQRIASRGEIIFQQNRSRLPISNKRSIRPDNLRVAGVKTKGGSIVVAGSGTAKVEFFEPPKAPNCPSAARIYRERQPVVRCGCVEIRLSVSYIAGRDGAPSIDRIDS